MVLEYVEGGDCAALLKNTGGPLPLDLARYALRDESKDSVVIFETVVSMQFYDCKFCRHLSHIFSNGLSARVPECHKYRGLG